MSRQIIIPDSVTETELAMFYLLCQKAYEAQQQTAEINVSEFTGNYRADTDEWTRWTMAIMSRLMSIRGYESSAETGRSYFQIVEKYSYISDSRMIRYRLTEDGYLYAVRMCVTFRLSDLNRLLHLHGKYSRRLAQLLLDHKLTGYCQIALPEFYDLLEIPYTYPTKELTRRILRPNIRQIEDAGLIEHIDYKYQNRGFGRANLLIFTWQGADQAEKTEKKDGNYRPLMNSDFEQNW